VALLLALLSAAFYGTADFLGGLAARRAPLLAATVAAQGAGLVPCAAGVADPGRGLARWGVGPGRW